MTSLLTTVVAALALCAALATAAPAQAGPTASGDPAPLTVASALPGALPSPVADAGTTLSLSRVPAGARLTARLDAALPPGVTLRVTVAAPAGAAGLGPVVLGTGERDVVRQLPAGDHTGLAVTYELVATPAAGVVAPSAAGVVFTLHPAP